VTGTPSSRGPWLVSARWDVAVFGGSAALAFAFLALGRHPNGLDRALPPWIWLLTVVFVDVAHVWATAYRVYLDPEERGRRPGLYLGVPLAAYVFGVFLYSISPGVFWRVLAYVAVIHFVRQQYGWVALYRRRLGSSSKLDRILDDAAIYSATLYPLLYWHAHLPREFEWFIAGDFIPGLPASAADLLWPVHLGITAAFVVRQVYLLLRGRPVSFGKVLVVASTWLSWHAGIVVFDSDYAFTVTNVLVHGIPTWPSCGGTAGRGSASRRLRLPSPSVRVGGRSTWPRSSRWRGPRSGGGTGFCGTSTPASSRARRSLPARLRSLSSCRSSPCPRPRTTCWTRGSGGCGRRTRTSPGTSGSAEERSRGLGDAARATRRTVAGDGPSACRRARTIPFG
jgi:hypothetical protein